MLDFAESQHQLAILTSELGILKKQLHTWLHRIQASLLLPLKLVTKSVLVSVDTDWALTQQCGITSPFSQPCRGKVGQDHKHCLHHFCSL